MKWLEDMQRLAGSGEAHVLVTLAEVRGSAPRPVGTKMLVSQQQLFGSIGGGMLEHKVIAAARQLLVDATRVSDRPFARTKLLELNLAKDAAQCCGGVVSVLLEYMCCEQSSVVIFGAGHVAQALLSILSQLPLTIEVVDSRVELLRSVGQQFVCSWVGSEAGSIPGHAPGEYHPQPSALTALQQAQITLRLDPSPAARVAGYQAATKFLILSHSHDLDFELCEAILSSDVAAWCGLIASSSKAASFRKRLSRKGFAEDELARLIAPVGLQQVSGKEPMAVAVSIAAQLLTMDVLREQKVSASTT